MPGTGDGDGDRDRRRDHHAHRPHRETVAGAVEPREPARHVAARRVRQQHHDHRDDPAGDAEHPRVLARRGGEVRGDPGEPHDKRGERRQQHRQPDGDQPAEERGADLEPAEAFVLVLVRRRQGAV
jgi:hypothetical protein